MVEFKQNKQLYLTMCLDFETIDQNSEVLIYGVNPKGYQRAPELNHYNKIKEYILNNENFVFPTSIILAIDDTDLKFFSNRKAQDFNNIQFPKNKKIFRIVDGQHRIVAMREAIKEKEYKVSNYEIGKIKKFPFNVIVVVTEPKKRSVEMEMFYDINSKGKRIKVDLIELARFNYRILEKSLNYKETNEHIAIQTAYELNENIKDNIWNGAIKFGIHQENVFGVIGVNAFRESISGIIDSYLKFNDKSVYKNYSKERLIIYSQKTAKNIAEFLSEAWDKVIYKKWEYSFKPGEIQMDLFQDKKKIFYNSKFYIQRTMGAKALNGILSDVVNSKLDKKINGLNKSSLNFFRDLIFKSKITSDDWIVGGIFSGYSSESGFKKVAKIILGQPIEKHK